MGITVVEVITSGPKGDAGTPGTSTEAGGTVGQVLRKVSNNDFDADWGDVAAAEVTFTSVAGLTSDNVQSGIDEVNTSVDALIDANRYVDKASVNMVGIVTEGLYIVDTGLPNGWLTGTLEVLKTKDSTLVTQILEDDASGVVVRRTSTLGTGNDWTAWVESVKSARITTNTLEIAAIENATKYTLDINIDVNTIVTEGLHIVNNYIPSSLPSGVSSDLELVVNKYSNELTYPNKIVQTLTDVTTGVVYVRSANDDNSPVWSVWSVKIKYTNITTLGSLKNATVPSSLSADLVNSTAMTNYSSSITSNNTVNISAGTITIDNTGTYRLNIAIEMTFDAIGSAEKTLAVDLEDMTATSTIATATRYIPANGTHLEVVYNNVVNLTANHHYALALRSEEALTTVTLTPSTFDIESIVY